METAIISGIVAITSTLLTLYFNNRKSKREVASNEKITKDQIQSSQLKEFYSDLLERVESLEGTVKELREKLEKRTAQYWALYRWLVSLYQTGQIEKKPPRFHQMSVEQINSKFEKQNFQTDVETSS